MSIVDKFCFCGRLETGGMVVGILGIIGNIIIIIGTIAMLVFVGHAYGIPLDQNATEHDREQYEAAHTILLGLNRKRNKKNKR